MNMQYTDLIWLMAGMFVISLTYIFTLLIVSIIEYYIKKWKSESF